MILVIFDCDGVLVDSEALLIDSEMKFLKQHGIEYSTEYYIANFMGIPVRDWKAKALALLIEKTGQPLTEAIFEPLEKQISKKIKEELQPVTGAPDAISDMKHRKCVASSSSNQSLHSKLASTDLRELFSPHIYSTELVKNGKPAPDLFLYAANQLNVLSADCVVVEDSANGVTAGKRAGMQVIGFTGGSHCPANHASSLQSNGADFIASSFSEVVKILETRLALD